MQTHEELIMKYAVIIDGKKRLSCAQAFKMSQEQNISLKEIGELCNQFKIKIQGCQLGCFK
jgi:hypothetical protein